MNDSYCMPASELAEAIKLLGESKKGKQENEKHEVGKLEKRLDSKNTGSAENLQATKENKKAAGAMHNHFFHSQFNC